MLPKLVVAVLAWVRMAASKTSERLAWLKRRIFQSLETVMASLARRTLALREDVRGFVNLGVITGVLTAIVIGIILLLVVSNLAPTFITAVADLVNAVENTSFNNTTADKLRSTFGLLIALGGLFAIVTYAFLAYRRRSRA